VRERESERTRARERVRQTGVGGWDGGEREGEGGRGREDLSYYSPILLAVVEASSAMAIAVLEASSAMAIAVLEALLFALYRSKRHRALQSAPTPYCSKFSNGHARYYLAGWYSTVAKRHIAPPNGTDTEAHYVPRTVPHPIPS
jgi:hypothetical protein